MNFDQVVLHTILAVRALVSLFYRLTIARWMKDKEKRHSITAPRTAGWSVWMDSNHRPRAYQARALTTWATDRGGDDGIRTHDPLLAGQVLSQLSYTPILMGYSGLYLLIKTWQLNNKIHKYSIAYTPSAWVVCFFVLLDYESSTAILQLCSLSP